MTETDLAMQEKSGKVIRSTRFQVRLVDGLLVLSFLAVFFGLIFLLSK